MIDVYKRQALSSLKGPKHGGANIKVVEMMRDLREQVSDLNDEEAIKAYLGKLLDKHCLLYTSYYYPG